MLRYLTIPLILMWCGCVTAAPRDFGILGGKARVGLGGSSTDLGHNPDLGLTSSWSGTGETRAHWINTSTDRADLLALWGDLRDLDVGNSVSTNANTRFSGGTVTNYYIATDGDNGNSGTEGSPWATLAYAWSQLPTTFTQNYQINVKPGTYLADAIELKDKTIAPYYVRIVGIDRPVFSYSQSRIDSEWTEALTDGYVDDGSSYNGTHYPALIYLNDENVEIRGFRFVGIRNLLPNTDFSESLIWMQSLTLDAGESVIIADNEISQSGHCGIKGGSSSGGTVYIDGNFLHDNGFDGFDHNLYPDGNNWVVRRNLTANTTGLGLNGNNANREDYIVTHNIFMTGYHGLAMSGKGWTAVHNIIYRNNFSGFFLYREGVDGYFANNIVYESEEPTDNRAAWYDHRGAVGGYPLAFEWDHNYVETGGTVNQLTTDPVSGIPLWDSGTSYANVAGKVIRTTAGRYYRLWGAVGLPGATEPTAEGTWTTDIADGANTLRYMGTNLAQNVYTNTTTGDNSAGAVFVDVSNFDFTIKTGSSAASAGTDLGYAGGALPGVWSSTQ